MSDKPKMRVRMVDPTKVILKVSRRVALVKVKDLERELGVSLCKKDRRELLKILTE